MWQLYFLHKSLDFILLSEFWYLVDSFSSCVCTFLELDYLLFCLLIVLLLLFCCDVCSWNCYGSNNFCVQTTLHLWQICQIWQVHCSRFQINYIVCSSIQGVPVLRTIFKPAFLVSHFKHGDRPVIAMWNVSRDDHVLIGSL